MADVRDQDARGPIEPHVSPPVVDLDTLGAVPDHRRLAAHRSRLVLLELFEDGDRFGDRNLGDDAAILGGNKRDFSGLQLLRDHNNTSKRVLVVQAGRLRFSSVQAQDARTTTGRKQKHPDPNRPGISGSRSSPECSSCADSAATDASEQRHFSLSYYYTGCRCPYKTSRRRRQIGLLILPPSLEAVRLAPGCRGLTGLEHNSFSANVLSRLIADLCRVRETHQPQSLVVRFTHPTKICSFFADWGAGGPNPHYGPFSLNRKLGLLQ